MIAIVVDDYEQAIPYLAIATPLGTRYVVVAKPSDLTGALDGAAFLGGSEELRALVDQMLEIPGVAVLPSG